jgi:hypothetical protein
LRRLEWWLAFAPWRSEEATAAYERAVEGSQVTQEPIPPFSTTNVITVLQDLDKERLPELMEALTGQIIPEPEREAMREAFEAFEALTGSAAEKEGGSQ